MRNVAAVDYDDYYRSYSYAGEVRLVIPHDLIEEAWNASGTRATCTRSEFFATGWLATTGASTDDGQGLRVVRVQVPGGNDKYGAWWNYNRLSTPKGITRSSRRTSTTCIRTAAGPACALPDP